MTKTKSFSITRRLAIRLTATLSLFWLGAVLIGGYIIQHELDEAFDESLRQSAARLLPLAIHDLGENEREFEPFMIAASSDASANYSFYIFNSHKKIVISSGNVFGPKHRLDIPKGFSNIDTRNGIVRLFRMDDPRTRYGIVLAESAKHRQSALLETILGLLFPLAALIPLAAIGIWLVVRSAMKPIAKLNADIAKRDSRNLSPLDIDEQPVELQSIAREIADLMQRLKQALEVERTFAANSAHELRTPLAGALAQLQRMSIEIDEKEKGYERIKDVQHSLKHLSNLSEQLLQMSRLESGFAVSDEVIELTPILELLVKDFARDQTMTQTILLENEGDFEVSAPITKDAFATVIRNLIQNAVKHGDEKSDILVSINSKNSISVRNHAPMIDEKTLGLISQPFHRGQTRADGTGLGLSIVRSVLAQCSGQLHLKSRLIGDQSIFEAEIQFNNSTHK